MKKVIWWLDYHGGEFEVEDDTSEEEIEEMARDEAFSCIDCGYEVEEQP